MVKSWMLLLCLLPVQQQAAADAYRWVDEHGQMHFTDRPPAAGGKRLELAPQPAAPRAAPPDRVPDRDRLLQMYEREREQREAAKAEQDQARAERRRRCAHTASTLRDYQAGGPLYQRRPDGSRKYFTAADKDREMARLRGLLDRHCGGVPTDLRPRTGR